jgi:hypothetical protein
MITICPPFGDTLIPKEAWTNKFRADARIPALVLNPAEIEAESTRLSSCIEETSIAIFDQRKEYSPRGARWWNNDCQQAVREVRNAATTETRKAVIKRSVLRVDKITLDEY